MILGAKDILPPLIPDCSVLRTLTIHKNIRNPLIFLRKMATYSCFLAGQKFRNLPASKLASDFRPFDPGIMLLQYLLHILFDFFCQIRILQQFVLAEILIACLVILPLYVGKRFFHLRCFRQHPEGESAILCLFFSALLDADISPCRQFLQIQRQTSPAHIRIIAQLSSADRLFQMTQCGGWR